MSKKAIIIGAGPAGLTAAYELLKRTDIKPIIFEETNEIGGISKTINYKGNRIDIGGHRFFSKSDRVVSFWKNILPLQSAPGKFDLLTDNGFPKKHGKGLNPDKEEKIMLIRKRLSRIYFLRKFFDYPIKLNKNTIKNLGLKRIAKIGLSYLKVKIKPIKNEKTLEDFYINRFGKELYGVFFKDYTKKVWGVPCKKISSEWGAQRVKGLSITKAILHSIKSYFLKDKINQKNVETSLIEQFMYPKYGPGQLWEEVANQIKEMGGKIYFNHKVIGFNNQDGKIKSIKTHSNGKIKEHTADYFFSTMPIKDLINGFENKVPEEVKKVSDGLMYRDFITVGLLLKKLKIKNETKIKTLNDIIPDNWIYVQEPDVKIGRIQIFNNWSPYMIKDKDKVWIGLEYFCNEGDNLWDMPDEKFINFAINELVKIGIIEKEDVLDSTIIRVPKTYPAYFGTYYKFDILRKYLDTFENLFLIGRNGMHRYNNQDHSMLTAMTAVDNIIKGIKTKNNIWKINTEKEYHEVKK